MKFDVLFTYCKMKDMIVSDQYVWGGPVLDSEDGSELRQCRIAKQDIMHAKIMYRTCGDDLAFVYADIFFTGYGSSSKDRIFIKNAKVSDLKNQLIGYDQ